MRFDSEKHASVRGLFDAMEECETDEGAREWFAGYVAWMGANATGEAAGADPAGVCRQNVGYVSGYGASQETIQRFERVAGACHPIFGSLSKSQPSAEDALAAGKKVGES